MNILEILVTIGNVIIECICVSYLMTVILALINKGDSTKINKRTFWKFCVTNLIAFTANRFIHIVFPDFKWMKAIIFTSIASTSAYLYYKCKVYKGAIASISCLAMAAILEIVMVLALTGFDVTPLTIASNIYYNSLYASCLSFLEAAIAFAIQIYSKSLASVENKLKYFLPQLLVIIICMFPSMALLMINDFKYSELFIFSGLYLSAAAFNHL